MKHTNFHPEINKLLDQYWQLKNSAKLRANDLMRDDIERARSDGYANAYAFIYQDLLRLEI